MNHIIKNGVLVLVIGVVVGLAIYITPVKKEKTIQGVTYSIGNYEQVTPIDIVLQGRYKKGLFASSQFSGKISIEGYGVTAGTSLMSTINFKDGKGNLVYSIWNEKTNKMQDYFLGSIYTNPSFTKFTILVNDQVVNDQVKDIDEYSDWTWSESKGKVITAPASSAQEALKIADALTKKSGLQLNPK